MAENRYSRHREEQLFESTSVRQFRIPQRSGSVVLRDRYRTAESASELDYMQMKVDMRSMFDELKDEMQSQHERTRAEVRTARNEILAAVKSSPAAFIELACEIGFVLLLFSLVVRFTLNLELVNTAFAIFMLFTLTLYWSMARLKRHSQKRRN
jgi:Flp pilus assembly protein TadB